MLEFYLAFDCWLVSTLFYWVVQTHLQLIRKKMVKSAKQSIEQQASNSEIYGNMHAVFIEMDKAPHVSSQKNT